MLSIARTGIAGATIGLLVLLVPPEANAGRAAPDADAGWAAIEKCAALTEDQSRHACLDDVLRRAGLMGTSGSQPKSTARVAEGSAPPSAAQPGDAGRGEFGLQKSPRQDSAPREADRADVTLASVRQGGDGKLVLTTTDGAVWLQVESDPVREPPARGQSLVIERTLFGGYRCRSGRWVAFRCRRVR